MKAVAAVVAAIVAVVALLFVATVPTAPPEMTEAELAQIEAEATQAIADQWDGFKNAIMNQDVEGWQSLWTSDPRVLEPGMDLSGSDLFAAGREFFESGGEVVAFDLESLEIFVHGDAAYQIAQYVEFFQAPDQEPVEVHANLFARWARQPDGVWKIDRFLAGPRNALPEG